MKLAITILLLFSFHQASAASGGEITEKLNWVCNPCFDHPGRPFRNFYAYALKADGTLLERKTQECSAKVRNTDDQTFSTVEEWFSSPSVGITNAQCEPSGEACQQCDSVNLVTGGSEKGKGSSKHSSGCKIENKREEESIVKTWSEEGHHFVSPIENSFVFYYGKELAEYSVNEVSGDTNTPPVQNKTSMKDLLHRIVSAAHVQKRGQYDQLFENCSQDLKQDETCVEQSLVTYYDMRKKLFGDIDLTGNEKTGFGLADLYCEKNFSAADFAQFKDGGPGPDKIPDANVINLEHSWPQSRFNCDVFHLADLAEDKKLDRREALFQKTDMHHLYPSFSKLNSFRQNYEYAEVQDGKKKDYPACTQNPEDNVLGKAVVPAGLVPDGKTYFQPPRDHRGDIARSLFYFSVRFNSPIGPIEEFYLRKWHKEDPADEVEIARNEKIYKAQGTRNPFIDMPTLVDQIQDF